MSTFSNTAREVEMPNGDVVVLHNAVTPNSTSNIKKFKYDDNGHVTESEAANATDLNLNSYATPTSGTTAIGTSDDVQTAIGKLDHQSHIDQTNILYALQTGVKNLFDLKNADITAVTNISIVKTDTSLTVTTTGEKKWSHVSIPMELEAGTYHVLATISNRTADASAITRFIVASNAGGSSELGSVTFTNNGTIDFQFTTTGGTVYLIPYPNYSSTGYNSTFTASEIMVCTKAAWDQEPNVYRQFALPNSDLTYLEAEDRASLAEVVDSGAKNLLINKGQLSYGDVTFTWNNDGSVTVSGTKTAGAECYVNIIDNVPYSNMGLKAGDTIVLSNNGTNVYIAVIFWASGSGYTSSIAVGNGAKLVVLPTNKTNILIRLTVRADATSVSETIKPMVCTKAAFDVSKAFVPYRPNYDLVCDKIVWNEVNLSSSADLNTLFDKNTSWVSLSGAVSATISNTPWTGGGFCVHNEAITTRAAIKSGAGGLFYQCLTPNNEDTIIMFRRKYDGSRGWDPWYKFDGGTQVN